MARRLLNDFLKLNQLTGAGISGHPFGRVLIIVFLQNTIKIRRVLPHSLRLIKKLLGGNCKKFCFICCTIGIKKRFPALARILFKAQIFTRTYQNPVMVFSPVLQWWCSVGHAIQHIKLVSKFMVNHVVTAFGIAAATQGSIPDDNYRPILECLADDGMGDFGGCDCIIKETRPALRGNNRRRINNDGFNIPIIIMGQSKKKQTSLCRNRYANFICKFQSAGSNPIFLSDKDLSNCPLSFR